MITIDNVGDHEVIAWNQGPDVVGTFTEAIEAGWESGASATLTYTQTSTTTFATSTVVATLNTNAPTLNTAAAPAGTAAGFTSDTSPTLVDGPNATMVSPPLSFTGTLQFIVTPASQTFTVVPTVPTVPGSPPLVPVQPPHLIRQADGTGQPYRVVLVDMFGAVESELPNAAIQPITWSLDEAESFSFLMPTLDPLADLITVADQEVQVWRNGHLLVWGVVVRSMATGATIEYQCRGLAWYFTKRFIGGARHNFLQNHSFETSGGWFTERFMPTEEPLYTLDPNRWTSEVTSERSLTGFPGRSLKLSSDGTIIFGVQALQFIWHEIDSTEWPDGITWTAAAWAYIPSSEWGEYDAEADAVVGERNAAYNWGGESAPFGLHLGRFSTTSSQEQSLVNESYPEVYEISVAGITEETPRDQWVRFETSLVQPPEPGGGVRTDWIQINLNCPIGTVYWDEVSLTRNDRLHFNDAFQEVIMMDLVSHAQDPAFGKSNLNITPVVYEPITTRRTRTYPFFNRALVSDAIDEFSTLWQGCDWSIECTGTERRFRPWSPMKGTYRPGQALVLGQNIASISVANDGEQIANRVVVMSDSGGSGSSREEAIGTDTTGFSSGLVLETSMNAAPDSPVDSLEGQMQRALRQKRDATIPTLTTHERVGLELLGRITTGDVVPVTASYGGLVVSGDHRIVAITFNPSDETMDITVNPFDDARDPASS